MLLLAFGVVAICLLVLCVLNKYELQKIENRVGELEIMRAEEYRELKTEFLERNVEVNSWLTELDDGVEDIEETKERVEDILLNLVVLEKYLGIELSDEGLIYKKIKK